MSPKTVIVITVIANAVAAGLTALAASGVWPAGTPVLTAVAGILVGWVNAQRPQVTPPGTLPTSVVVAVPSVSPKKVS